MANLGARARNAHVNALLRAGQVTPALRARSAAPVLRSVGCSMRGTGPLLSPLCPEGLSRAIASKAGALAPVEVSQTSSQPSSAPCWVGPPGKQNKAEQSEQVPPMLAWKAASAQRRRGDKQEAARKASKTRAPGSKVIERVNGPGRRHVADLYKTAEAFCLLRCRRGHPHRPAPRLPPRSPP